MLQTSRLIERANALLASDQTTLTEIVAHIELMKDERKDIKQNRTAHEKTCTSILGKLSLSDDMTKRIKSLRDEFGADIETLKHLTNELSMKALRIMIVEDLLVDSPAKTKSQDENAYDAEKAAWARETFDWFFNEMFERKTPKDASLFQVVDGRANKDLLAKRIVFTTGLEEELLYRIHSMGGVITNELLANVPLVLTITYNEQRCEIWLLTCQLKVIVVGGIRPRDAEHLFRLGDNYCRKIIKALWRTKTQK